MAEAVHIEETNEPSEEWMKQSIQKRRMKPCEEWMKQSIQKRRMKPSEEWMKQSITEEKNATM